MRRQGSSNCYCVFIVEEVVGTPLYHVLTSSTVCLSLLLSSSYTTFDSSPHLPDLPETCNIPDVLTVDIHPEN